MMKRPTTKNTKTLWVSLLLIIGALYIGYAWGDNDSSARSSSQIERSQNKQKIFESENDRLQQSNTQLQADYDQLADKYKELYALTVRYINATQYAPNTTIHCNSYSYGMNGTSTTCY